MVERRKDFLINSAYVGLWLCVIYFSMRFTLNYMMPFIFGFLIAFLLKPFIRKLNAVFNERKFVAIFVIIVFYIILTIIITWAIISIVAFVQHYIPIVDSYTRTVIIPMANDLFEWAQNLMVNLDPRVASIVDTGIAQLERSLVSLVEIVSSSTLSLFTGLVTSIPRLLVAILISVISSFFFSLDYQNIVNTVMDVLPKRASYIIMEAKYLLNDLLGSYAIAYAKLISITFVELSIGFLILKVDNPIVLAAVVAVVDILPVLGTGTVLIPWMIYEFILGSFGLGIGLLVLYVVITIVRNVLESRVIGKQIGLHPLLTLVSIFVGMSLLGFWGLFVGPLAVTILKRLHEQDKLNMVNFFRGDVDGVHSDIEIIEEIDRFDEIEDVIDEKVD